MNITQTYHTPSTVKTDSTSSSFDFSAESSRGPVSLKAFVKNSLAYARVMMALRKVVVGDWRPKQVDHSDYQKWVMEEYLKELPSEMGNIDLAKVRLMNKRDAITSQKNQVREELKNLNKTIPAARQDYYNWLYKNDRDKWIVLDPVISVHKDSVIFEAFSLDESLYGRVSVPNKNLECYGDTEYGTTNIDFSQTLADELYRVRNYRPAFLNVNYHEVSMNTSLGTSVEKKIDLPETWVRGFLQVQSASSLDGVDFKMNSNTLADIISILEQKKEKQAPRSLRFQFEKGKKVRILIEPWNIEIQDSIIYNGDFNGEIRLWGRRRLSVLKDLLPLAKEVQVKMLGSGMPSYWSVCIQGHRYDIGLSGWTANDWANKANFDLLASTGAKNKDAEQKAEQIICNKLILKPDELAELAEISISEATTALQELCKKGKVMYDHITDYYRYRKLIQHEIETDNKEEEERNSYAYNLLQQNHLHVLESENLYHKYCVKGKKDFITEIFLDKDHKVQKAICTCSYYKQNKLRKGPCAHLVASVLHIQQNNESK
ncbi:MAG: hypothetical protein ACEPOW_06660 [Bacteroidales bacterium]